MKVVEVLTGITYPVEVEKADYTLLKKDRYFFDWAEETGYDVYKLTIKGNNDILGLISLERIPEEWRVHIRLLTVSKENMGTTKKFDRITGNLLVHASKLALQEFGELACISLRPKTQIARHYVEKYKMNIIGMTLSLEVPEILDLINEYENG